MELPTVTSVPIDPATLPASELPDWLSPPINPLPKYPTTPEQRQINEIHYAALFETVLDLLVEGQSVKTFVQTDPRQISYGRFMQWVKRDPTRLQRYREAQAIGTEVMAEEMKEISDGLNSMEDVQRSTLRVNTRKWLMQSWNRERYGEKQQVEMTNTTTINIRSLLEEREKRIAAIEPLTVEGEATRVG